jgi:ketosteroid isomerase-like protein
MVAQAHDRGKRMYHLIVRRQLRRAFAWINAGAYHRIVPQFAADHEHAFPGEHPLGGTRRSMASTERWYARLAALLPGLRFSIESVAVSGWPWDTTATVEWTDQFPLGDGEVGHNQGVHVFRLRWGRVVRLAVYTDTQKLAGYCAQMSARGNALAAAAAIVD